MVKRELAVLEGDAGPPARNADHGPRAEVVELPAAWPGRQVDFGDVGKLYDPRAGVGSRACVFVMVLGHPAHCAGSSPAGRVSLVLSEPEAPHSPTRRRGREVVGHRMATTASLQGA